MEHLCRHMARHIAHRHHNILPFLSPTTCKVSPNTLWHLFMASCASYRKDIFLLVTDMLRGCCRCGLCVPVCQRPCASTATTRCVQILCIYISIWLFFLFFCYGYLCDIHVNVCRVLLLLFCFFFWTTIASLSSYVQFLCGFFYAYWKSIWLYLWLLFIYFLNLSFVGYPQAQTQPGACFSP